MQVIFNKKSPYHSGAQVERNTFYGYYYYFACYLNSACCLTTVTDALITICQYEYNY